MPDRREDLRFMWISGIVLLVLLIPKGLWLLKKPRPESRSSSVPFVQKDSGVGLRPDAERKRRIAVPFPEERDKENVSGEIPGSKYGEIEGSKSRPIPSPKKAEGEKKRLMRLGRGVFSPGIPFDKTYIFVDGQVKGIGQVPAIELPAGFHRIHISNFELNVALDDEIDIIAGETISKAYMFPQRGTILVSAIPWAEVFIRGESFGVTPIEKIELPVGYYEIVFRHPSFPEKRIHVIVKGDTILKMPPVDMR